MDKIISILAGVLKIDSSRITMETTPGDVENWDSLAQLSLIQKIEEEYGLTLDIREILEIKKVGDICRILEKRGVRGRWDVRRICATSSAIRKVCAVQDD